MSETFVRKFINKLEDYSVKKATGKPCGYALDIGANRGMYSPLLAKKFQHVYAFEPHPENIVKLKEQISKESKHLRNPLHPNITIIEKAISNKTGKGKLFVSRSNAGGHSISQIVATKQKWGHDIKNFIEVDFITLDDFVERHSDLNGKKDKLEFLKVDIEGAEDFIFEGAKKTLEKFKLDIMLEMHRTVDCNRLYHFFSDMDYKWYNEAMDETSAIIPDSHYLISNSDREVDW